MKTLIRILPTIDGFENWFKTENGIEIEFVPVVRS